MSHALFSSLDAFAFSGMTSLLVQDVAGEYRPAGAGVSSFSVQ